MPLDRRLALGSLLTAGALVLAACGGPDRSVEAFCERLQEAEAVGERFANVDPSDLEGTQEAYSEASEEIGRISEVAPQEIQKEVEEIDQALTEIADVADEAESPEQLRERLAGLRGRFSGIEEASQRVAAFEQQNCDGAGGSGGGENGGGEEGGGGEGGGG